MSLSELLKIVKSSVALLSPRHRRWKRFLKTLPLTPDQLHRPVEAPTTRDFIICGSPRTGTTLLSAMLFQPPAIITVMEPWDGLRLSPATLFASIREEIEATGIMRRGKLNIEILLKEGVVRWCREGESVMEVNVVPDFLLGIKWPTFWQYLELLPKTKFLVCVRHPVEVVNSFKKNGGRVGKGLEYEVAFNQKMNQELQSKTSNIALRRVFLYDYINACILPNLSHPNVFTVHYERWFTEPQTLVAELSAFLETQLSLGPAIIRPPHNKLRLTPDEIALIRSHCHTAQLLGYQIDQVPVYGPEYI